MGKSKGDKRPYLKPVTRIELDESNVKLRWIAAGVLLLIGIAAIAFGFSTALSVQPGWEEVTASSQETHCAADFKLMYDFSDTGGNAAAVNKALIQRYSDAAVEAYRLFTPDEQFPGMGNMAVLNAHINEAVQVEPELYRALEQVVDSGSRQLYLSPARAEYNRVFLCQQDDEAALYDPNRDADTQAWLAELAVYVSDPEQIRLELLGENQVQLTVGPEYLAFAQEYGIEIFADFGWMRNAFAADLIAQALNEGGYTKGYLTSFDGFTRNLDVSGEIYSQNIFTRIGNDIFLPARMDYAGPISLVSLRNYPMTEHDRWSYYSYQDGSITTIFLDPEDCRDKSALGELTVYSGQAGCAELLLAAEQIFISDDFQAEALVGLKEQGIHSVWMEGKSVCYNDESLDLELLSDSGSDFTKAFQ